MERRESCGSIHTNENEENDLFGNEAAQMVIKPVLLDISSELNFLLSAGIFDEIYKCSGVKNVKRKKWIQIDT